MADGSAMIKEWLNQELEEKYANQPDIVKKVQAGMKHIKCFGCLDTRKSLFTSESFFGGTYEQFSCPACTGSRNRQDSHHQLHHAQVNGRQIPYNGGDRNVGYSRIMAIYNIYKNEYEQSDLANEKAERERAAAALIAKQNEPKWEFVANNTLEREIGSIDAKIDIGALVGDITQLLSISAGNIASLPTFLKSLDISLNYYWTNEKAQNHTFEKMKDDEGRMVYVKFEYSKVTREKKGGLGLARFMGSSKKQCLSVSYLLMRPMNTAAEAQCDDLMNKTVQSVISKLRM